MKSVLIFLEDPGAVNFFRPLPTILKEAGLEVTILATGLASEILEREKIKFVRPESPFNAESLLQRLGCKLVLLGTSDNRTSLSFTIIEQCKVLKIPTVAGIDAAVNASERFKGTSQNPLCYLPDWLFVADTESKEAFEALGVSKKCIKVVGHPHFDDVINLAKSYSNEERLKLRLKLLPYVSAQKRIITFLSQPETNFVDGQMFKSQDYSLMGWGESIRRSEIVLQELLDALKPYRSQISFGVRLHPKNNIDDFERYTNDLDFLSSGGDPLELVLASDVIIGLSTMLLAESILMGKNTFAVLPRKIEKNWLPGLVKSVIPIAFTRQELRDVISAIMRNQLVQKDLRKNLKLPKNSAKRMVTQITKIISDKAES